MKNIQIRYANAKGFNLIELMVVTAVMGILVAVALNSYYTYTTRAKVLEGLSLASAIRTGVAENYAEGKLAGLARYAASVADEMAAGNISTAKISSLAVAPLTGVITVVYNSDGNTGGMPKLLGANTVAFTPHIGGLALATTVAGGAISWECAGADGAVALSNYAAAATGSVNSKYLPGECR